MRVCTPLLADQDNDGMVSPAELKKMMQHLGNPLNDQETSDILKEAGCPQLDYAAFCKLLGVNVKSSREAEADEEMHHAFKLFDRDGDGVITSKEMTEALRGFGVQLTDREVDQVYSRTHPSAFPLPDRQLKGGGARRAARRTRLSAHRGALFRRGRSLHCARARLATPRHDAASHPSPIAPPLTSHPTRACVCS
jgi:calmodulin